ncbi:MAG: PAS domain S-box protein [Opitutus sp.]
MPNRASDARPFDPRSSRRDRAGYAAISGDEHRLRRFIKQVPAAVAMFDTEMRYLEVSDRWLQDCELQAEDVIGRFHYDVVPHIPGRWKATHRRVLAGATETCDRDVFVRPNGRTEWLQWQLQPWHDADGNVGGLLMFTQFITDRVRVEEALKASEDRFRSAMSHSPVGMALVAVDGGIQEANLALSQVLGYEHGTLVGRNFWQTIHPLDGALDAPEIRRLLDAEIASYASERRFQHRDGQVVWAQLSVSAIHRTRGEPPDFVCQVQDITSRKREEAAAQMTVAKLSLAMEMAQIAYWEYDVASSRFTFDEHFYRLFGTTIAHEGGRYLSLYDYTRRFIPGSETAIVENEFARAIATKNPAYTRQLEHQFQRTDGTTGTMAVRLTVQTDGAGNAAKIYGINQDVSERKALEQHQRALEAQLRHTQKLEAISTLTGGLGHEFNNLLTGIMGNVQLAEMELPNTPAVQTCLREATNSCREASDLVSRLHAFSQSVEPKRAPTEFVEVVRNALDQLSPLISAAIELRVELPPAKLTVNCNAAQITTAILHLGTNAAHAMQESGGVLEVSLRHAVPEARWCAEHPQVGYHHTIRLSVRDNGTGMSPSLLARIFDPFFTTKPPGQGQGLGLPVVHGIMKRHGGAVVVESTQGTGTVVQLFFPEVTPPMPKNAQSSTAGPIVTPA